MDRQAIWDNFVKARNGNGRGVTEGGSCSYAARCAIGCQPGLADRFDLEAWDKGILTLEQLIGTDTDVGKFFGVECDGDVEFLRALQTFHDAKINWMPDDYRDIRHERAEKFVESWGIRLGALDPASVQ